MQRSRVKDARGWALALRSWRGGDGMTESRTKVVCTLGPACEDEETLGAMVEAGMDVARLNFSHGDHEWHRQAIERIRAVEERTGAHIGIIADLQGPRLRVGRLKGGEQRLSAGDEVILTTEDVVGDGNIIPVAFPSLPRDVDEGQRVLLDDGLLELVVLSTSERRVKCQVVTGGVLKEEKGINLPGARVSVRAVTAKDIEDVEFALERGVDWIAQSFVRSAQDVLELKEFIRSKGLDTPVIAKLEKPEALEELDAIICAADAIMVARGDMGVEMEPEKVPVAQKRIIARCMAFRTPVITATQMLDSMRENPRPTRAEATDVANAILDGTDAVMLSGETAVGKYPVQAVEMMVRIATQAERYQQQREHLMTDVEDTGERMMVADAVARAAAETAEKLGARLIVAFTQSGWTARLVSKCRAMVPIVAATPEPATARRCSLYWGVTPVIIAPTRSTDAMIEAVSRVCLEKGLVRRADTIVITAGSPLQPGTTNTMRVEKVGSGP